MKHSVAHHLEIALLAVLLAACGAGAPKYSGTQFEQALGACIDFTTQSNSVEEISGNLVNADWEERRGPNVTDDEHTRSRTLRTKDASIWYRYSDREHQDPVDPEAQPVMRRMFGCTIKTSADHVVAANEVFEAYQARTGFDDRGSQEHPEFGYVQFKQTDFSQGPRQSITVYFTKYVPPL